MGYQALLFCPDEKTARTVTQVLNELDFTVIPCTEPFAAVKKLMGEHFDAVVVDCDNEQNATLLFKSARNTPNNQSSLAVAVVEGQAGVAKAFRIGANLVLTKPINVDQAKGTLRVARGLLRKNESGKPAATAASAAARPATPVSSAPKPTPPRAVPVVPSVVAGRPAMPFVPLATASTPAPSNPTQSNPTQRPAAPPRVVASAPVESAENDAEILELDDVILAPPVVSSSAAASSAAKPGAQSSAPKISSAASPVSSSGAASAAAPARESKAAVLAPPTPSTAISALAVSVQESATGSSALGETSTSASVPAFTFGGTVASDGEAVRGGSKKTLLIIVAVVVAAALGYAVWMQWQTSGGAAVGSATITSPTVKAPAVLPQGASIPAPPLTGSSVPSSIPPSTSGATIAAPPSGSAKTFSDGRPATSMESAPAHAGKASAGTELTKPAASTVTANKLSVPKEAAQPIVIKSDAAHSNANAISDVPVPTLSGIPANNVGALPGLMGSAGSMPPPVLQTLKVSQGVSRGLLVKKVQPIYPTNALRLRLEGAIEIVATVSKTGDITAVKSLGGDPQLARAAIEAVRQWKYKPYLLNGEPVEIETQVTVNFKLPK
jgi:TonB family protein